MKTMLMALLLCSATLTSAQGQNLESEAYNVGYGHVLDANWREARVHLRGFLEQYPNSRRADAASFWLCYSGEKLERDPATTFNCYKAFAEQWPTSDWNDDARISMTRAAEQLAAQGRSEYMDILQTMKQQGDLEVRLSALEALVRQDKESAVKEVMDIYTQAEDIHLRTAVVEVLGRAQTERAYGMLSIMLARVTEREEQRVIARFLARSREGHGITALKLLNQQYPDDEEYQNRLLEAYYASRSRGVLDDVVELAKNTEHDSVAHSAISIIRFLTRRDRATDATPIIEELARQHPDNPRVAEALIMTYNHDKTDEGTARILAFVQSVPNSQLWARAIDLLSHRVLNGHNKPGTAVQPASERGPLRNEANYQAMRLLAGSDDSIDVQRALLNSYARIYSVYGVEPLARFVAEHENPTIRVQGTMMVASLPSDEWQPAIDVLIGLDQSRWQQITDAMLQNQTTLGVRLLVRTYLHRGTRTKMREAVSMTFQHEEPQLREAARTEVLAFIEAGGPNSKHVSDLFVGMLVD